MRAAWAGPVLATLIAYLPSAVAAQDSQPAASPSPGGMEEQAILLQEIGDRDPTYLRTRLVFRYDYKDQANDVIANRVRVKALYAFGPRQRLALSVMVPTVRKDSRAESATGTGDTEFEAGGNFYKSDRFRTGASCQVTFRTAGANLLGGSTTTIKPAWGFTATLAPNASVIAAFKYKHSLETVRGTPAKQFEPDIVFNVHVLRATWYVEWDSYYDLIPDQFAQTVKVGVSHAMGPQRQWVASIYYGAGVNAYGRQSQYRINPGVDVTWYLLENR